MQKLKRTSIIFVICAFLMAQFFMPISTLFKNFKAATVEDGVIEQISQTLVTQRIISVENGKFSDSNSQKTNGLGEVQYWEAIGNKEAPVETGIVNSTNFDDYIDKTNDTIVNPNLATENALLVSANGQNIGMGFKTSNTISFYQNSYYVVSVIFQTQNGGTATFALTGNSKVSENANSKAQGYTTASAGTWQSVDFFVLTNEMEDINLNIELWLDSKIMGYNAGTLLVREVSVVRYNHQYFHTIMKNSIDGYSRVVDLRNSNILPSGQENTASTVQNFEAGSQKTNILTFTQRTDEIDNTGSAGLHSFINDIPQLPESTLSNNNAFVDGDGNVYSNKQGLLFFSTEESRMAYTSSAINIKQQTSYRFSIYAFGNATANIRVTQLGEDGEYIKNKNEFFAVSYSGSEFHNGWTMQSIFIKGHPLSDTQIQIELWMGDLSSGSNGYVWFDDANLEIVDSNYLYTYNGNTNSHLLDLSPFTASSSLISNGNFNTAANVDVNTSYPLAIDSSWTENYVDTIYKNGIINTNLAHFNAHRSGNYKIPRPGGTSLQPNYNDNSTNNVYLMQVAGTLETPTFTLSSQNYYAISFEVQTFNSPDFSVKLIQDGSIILSEIEMLSSSAFGFETYTFFVKTNLNSTTYQIVFELGDVGCVVLDNVNAKQINSSLFDQKVHGEFNRVIDLNNSLSTNFYAPLFEYEMLDGSETPVHIDVENNLLSVSNSTAAYYTVSQVLKDQLADGEYYKLSFSLRIESINNGGFLSIGLTDIDEKFKQITTTNDVFVTYTFFIKATYENKIALVFEIGDEHNETAINFFVQNIKLETGTQAAHDSTVSKLESKNPPANVLAINSTTPSEDTTTPSDTTPTANSSFDPMLIGTIVMIAALVVAVTGVVLRKINFKFHIKRKQTTYARDDEDFSAR